MSGADALARKHPIAAFSLDALTAGAAKLRPDRLALDESGAGLLTQALSYDEFDRQVRVLAQHLIGLGLTPGERILIFSGARAACVIIALAALTARVEPLLVPIGLEAPVLAEIAASTGCVAIAAPTSYGALDLEETLFETAARCETIRLVATLGPGQADGAIDLAPERLLMQGEAFPAASSVRPRVGTLNSRREPVFHEQSALVAAGLDFLGKAEIAAGSHLVSTLAPASFASLVTGPVASLLSGAPLTLFGPFDAASFLALLDRTPMSHCVIPATILPDFEQSGLLREHIFASAISVVRDDHAAISPAEACPLIKVHAVEESGIRVERPAGANLQSSSTISGEVLAPLLPARQPERTWR